jgi:predicted nucleic acid-binding protein
VAGQVRDQVVSNASPLILLAAIGQFPLLERLFGQIAISANVFEEVVVHGAGRPGAREVHEAAFITPKTLTDSASLEPLIARTGLAAGEASTILLARELEAEVTLIDERAARSVARSMGIKVAGTLRVLELAHERGHLSDLRSAYEALRTGGARISEQLLQESLKRYGLGPLS